MKGSDMFREFLVWVSETLFYFTGGEMLANTIWIIPWVAFWAIFIMITFIVWIANINKYRGFLTGFIFFFGLMIVWGTDIVQSQMMTECRDSTASLQIFVDDELSETDEITIKQCRYKDNYYGEFGEWKLVGLD